MAMIQCRMCGGMVDLPEGKTSGECPYCGSQTTYPRVTDDHVEQLYNRAEHFRQICDFDKAANAYETLVAQGGNDPDAYWGLVLSRFGIEYVEDPVSHERIPTCHRVQFDSILSDPDYLKVLELSSGREHDLYEEQAKRIAELQKGILAISSKEKPYDVFICYKEATEGGTRTKDSALAQDIYYQLTAEGLKVFFARISLEEKLGQQYEPYIFAALNSAKVMLVIGMKKEYFNAVWVRNEWSRFLALMRKDRSKLLIPCYRDMDAYDIPEELSMLQSQDMSKIGFMQDIIHGVKKVVGKSDQKASTGGGAVSSSVASGEAALLKRARQFMDDGDWETARKYANRVLDGNPECGEAHLFLFLTENKLSSLTRIHELSPATLEDGDLKRALKYGDRALVEGIQKEMKLCREREFQRKENEAFQMLCGQVQDAFARKGYAERMHALNVALSASERFASQERGQEIRERLKAEIDSMEKQARSQIDAAMEKYGKANSIEEFDEVLAVFKRLEAEKIGEFSECQKACLDNIHSIQFNMLSDVFAKASTEKEYLDIGKRLEELKFMAEAVELQKRCCERVLQLRLDALYKEYSTAQTVEELLSVAERLEKMRDCLNGPDANKIFQDRILGMHFDALSKAFSIAQSVTHFLAVAEHVEKISDFPKAIALRKLCLEKALRMNFDALSGEFSSAQTEEQFLSIADRLEKLKDLPDAVDLARRCREKAHAIKMEALNAEYEAATTEQQCLDLAKKIDALGKDADLQELALRCRTKAHALKMKRLNDKFAMLKEYGEFRHFENELDKEGDHVDICTLKMKVLNAAYDHTNDYRDIDEIAERCEKLVDNPDAMALAKRCREALSFGQGVYKNFNLIIWAIFIVSCIVHLLYMAMHWFIVLLALIISNAKCLFYHASDFYGGQRKRSRLLWRFIFIHILCMTCFCIMSALGGSLSTLLFLVWVVLLIVCFNLSD